MVKISTGLLICLSLLSATGSNNNTCSTPHKDIGDCIGIRECSSLYNLVKQENTNSEVLQYIKKSHCGMEGRDPKVCCPRSLLSFRSLSNVQQELGKRYANLPSAAAGECGKNTFDSSKRVVGGQSSKQGQWPWMAAIGYKLRGKSNPAVPAWSCGGSLITRRYVLTAAHCVSPITTEGMQPYMVLLGNIDVKNSSALQVEIEEVIMHNNYNIETNFNDIALFRLKQEVPLGPNIQLICLPIEDKLRSETFVRKSPFVAGWGYTYNPGNYSAPKVTELRHVQVPVVSNPQCAEAYNSIGGIIDDNYNICAGSMMGGKDSCGGDSGGPLMLPIYNKKYYVIGIVSYGRKCAEPGYPGVYARVTNYIQWISDNIR